MIKWDEWRGSTDGRPVFYIKNLLECFGVRVSLHKMVGADDPGCFHTHPAKAWRIILWGGYEEEIYNETPFGVSLFTWKWWPGCSGNVTPIFCHRISKLLNGKSSYSLWIRFKKTHDIQLFGDGWAKHG